MNLKVTVLVFSGRPNPSWEISSELATKFMQQWKELPPVEGMQLPASQLGYQGCRIELSSSEYRIIYDGFGYWFKNGKQVEQKRDAGRKIEKQILNSVPSQYAELISQVVNF